MSQFASAFSCPRMPLSFHIPGASVRYGIKPFVPATIYPPAEPAHKAAKNRTEATVKQEKQCFGSKVLAGFSAAESECSLFSSKAAARAFSSAAACVSFGKPESKPESSEDESPEHRMEAARKKVRVLFGHEDV